LRVYVENTVWGFAFNVTKPQWQVSSMELFAAIQSGQHRLVVSQVVEAELLKGAPDEVLTFFYSLLPLAEMLVVNEAARRLRDAYLAEGFIPARKDDDALHVALATVALCDAMVSWDGQHIVKHRNVIRFNQINAQNGYPALAIRRPDKLLLEFS
jgi:hypothetical protein